MNVLIGPAQVREAESILKLQYLCYQSEAAIYGDYQIPPLTQTLGSFLAEYDTHRILVARIGEEVVGSVRAHSQGGSCLVSRLVVHPRLQGKGIGTKLLQSIEQEFQDATRYELFTGSRSDTNIRLYRHLGYSPFRTESVSPTLDLVYLEKIRTL